MFTGLIGLRGRLDYLRPGRTGGGMRIGVSHEPFDPPLVEGASVAVQGVCLTVRPVSAQAFTADILDETLRRSALPGLPAGSVLNLERALRLGDRLDGHWVTGHVDGTGRIDRIEPAGADWRLRISCPETLLELVAEKGSIGVDGVSLTVAAVGAGGFEVCIIPATWNRTSLCRRRSGDAVNLEADLLARYLRRLLEARDRSGNRIGLERLSACGF